jgi:hypothetical protein
MANASPLVLKLVVDRKHKSIGLEEYFAAIYLAHREALLPFWRDGRELDVFVREFCGLKEPVWWYWIDFYMWCKKHGAEMATHIPYSPAVFQVLDKAAKLALREAKGPGAIPKLELKHFMSALEKQPKLEFTRKMLDSGMKTRRIHLRARRD